MKRRYCRYVPAIFITLCGIFTLLLSHAIQDRILQFDSHITVHQDSSLTLREVIKLQSAGEWLKDRFNALHPVGEIPEHFEKYLQYAPALLEVAALAIGPQSPGVILYMSSFMDNNRLGLYLGGSLEM